MTRYTSATERDREQMLATDRRALDRRPVRGHPGGRAPRPAARPARRHAGGGGLRAHGRARRAQRERRERDHLPRRRDVRPLRPGDRRLDHAALGVPDPVHALPAGDLAGHAAGDVRVPDRDLGADRAAGRKRRPVRDAVVGRRGRIPGAQRDTGRDRFLVSRGLHPHARETLATYAAGFGAEVDEVPLADGATDPAALEAAVDEQRRGGVPPAAELPRHGRGPGGARAGGEARGRACS